MNSLTFSLSFYDVCPFSLILKLSSIFMSRWTVKRNRTCARAHGSMLPDVFIGLSRFDFHQMRNNAIKIVFSLKQFRNFSPKIINSVHIFLNNLVCTHKSLRAKNSLLVIDVVSHKYSRKHKGMKINHFLRACWFSIVVFSFGSLS